MRLIQMTWALTSNEHDVLKKLAHRSGCPVVRSRAKCIREMARTGRLTMAARVAGISPQYARSIIHEFNERGLDVLPAKHGGGRPRKLGSGHGAALKAFAGRAPSALGLPWTCWSVAKIHEAAIAQGIIPHVGRETLRITLHRVGITYQQTKTWKYSNDPEFHAKRARVKALYDQCPKDGVVVCVDEFGPLELRPYKGRSWCRKGSPDRVPATYHRPHGVRHLLAWYDVHSDVLGGCLYERKRGDEFLDFLQWLRSLYARWLKIYVVLDNFSPHKRADVQAWAKRHRMELVFIATNASWMNRIEAHFGPLKKFALENSFPRTHEELEGQLRRYLEWRNAHPKDERLIKEQKKRKVM